MNVILKNPLLRFAALFVIIVLVSALTAYLYHRSLLSFSIYAALIQLFALPLFLLLGHLFGSALAKKEFIGALVVVFLFLGLSWMIKGWSIFYLWQLAKGVVFCIGTLLAKAKKKPLDRSI